VLDKPDTLYPADLFIGGQSRPASTGRRFISTDPSTGADFASAAEGEAPDVDAAVRNAAAAFPAWRDRTPLDRGRIMMAIGRRLVQDADRIAALESRDTGKPLKVAKGDVMGTARYFEYYGSMADKLMGETIPLGDGYMSYTRHEPHGVVGVIIPWNGPINQAARSVAPALMMGNAVVAKPAEQTPVSCVELAKIAVDCGVPPGVFNVVPGYGHTAGAALVAHPLVRKVVFTGSVETGRIVAMGCAEKLIPVTLELGGKSPNIVFADADLDAAARGAWIGINFNSGQACSAGSRLLVQREVHDQVVDRLRALNAQTSIGPGSDDRFMGPLVSQEQKDRVEMYLGIARDEGVTVELGGDWQGDFPTTCYQRPALLIGARNDMRIAREEIFGPVLAIIPFDTEDEAIAVANDSEYGLVAGIWTSNLGRAHRVASRLEVGQIFINEYFAGGVETSFGGVKNSGYGREKGIAGAMAYSWLKTITIRVAP
jgi:aldehyde dehydrogenase (NAD+)